MPPTIDSRATVFVSGDDTEAKALVSALLNELGWPDRSILDLGGVKTAVPASVQVALISAGMRH